MTSSTLYRVNRDVVVQLDAQKRPAEPENGPTARFAELDDATQRQRRKNALAALFWRKLRGLVS